MLEILFLEPTSIAGAPVLLPRKYPAVTEQKRTHVLFMDANGLDRRRPRPDQVAHCLMRWIRNPNRCQFTCPQQAGKRDRVSAIGLHPVARLAGNERRGATVQECPSSVISRCSP